MPRQQSTGHTVYKLFNEAQRTTASHSKLVRVLWQLEHADSEQFYSCLCSCIQTVLLMPQVRDQALVRAQHCTSRCWPACCRAMPLQSG